MLPHNQIVSSSLSNALNSARAEIITEISPRVIYLSDLTEADQNELEESGFLIKNIYRITGVNHRIEKENCENAGLHFGGQPAFVENFLEKLKLGSKLGATEADFDAILKEVDSFYRFTLYQRTLAKNATFAIKSIFSNSWIKTTGSYVITSENWPTIAYKFSDAGRNFYLIANGALGNLLALYDEQSKTLLMFKQYNGRWGKDPQKWVGDFLLQLGRYSSEVKAYENAPTREYHSLLYTENIAHYYWNFMNGLQRAQDQDDKIKALFSRRTPVDCKAIFPNSSPQISPQSDNEIFLHVLRENLIVGLYTDYIASETLARRMISVAETRTPNEAQKYISEVAASNKIIVWILLRNIHRSWRNQVSGISNFINKMKATYGNCFFIFDGHTQLDEGTVSVQSQKSLQNSNLQHMTAEDDIMSEVIERTGIEDYHNLIGCNVYEKILWSEIPTFSVQPMGSGFLWTGWLSNRPAVLHTPPQSIPQFRATAYMREDCAPRVYVKPEYYSNAEDGPYLASSYDLDWRGIWEASQTLLNDYLRFPEKKNG